MIVMKRFITILAILLPVAVMAQTTDDEGAKKVVDPLDISQEVAQIELYGVPTVEAVKEMKGKADALYSSGTWEEAALAYEQYAKHANWLANIISQCVEPYYSASYDDRKNSVFYVSSNYGSYEKAANNLKKERNEAYVKIGLCYKQLGQVDKAITYLYKGLDLLSVSEKDMWKEAANAVSELVGFDPKAK